MDYILNTKNLRFLGAALLFAVLIVLGLSFVHSDVWATPKETKPHQEITKYAKSSDLQNEFTALKKSLGKEKLSGNYTVLYADPSDETASSTVISHYFSASEAKRNNDLLLDKATVKKFTRQGIRPGDGIALNMAEDGSISVEADLSAQVSSGNFTGTAKAALIHLRYTDGLRSEDPADTTQSFNTISNAFFDESSRNTFDLTGDAYGWVDMGEAGFCDTSPRTQYDYFDAVTGANLVNYDNYDFLIFVVDDSLSCFYAGSAFLSAVNLYDTVNNRIISKYILQVRASTLNNLQTFNDVIKHELGHNMGARHDNGYFCGPSEQTGQPFSLTNNPAGCDTIEYGDAYSIMGAVSPDSGSEQFTFVNRIKFGWLDSSIAHILSPSSTYGRFQISNRNNTYKTGLAFTETPLSTLGPWFNSWSDVGYFIEETLVTPSHPTPGVTIRFTPPENEYNDLPFRNNAIFRIPIGSNTRFFTATNQLFSPGDSLLDSYYNKVITYEERTADYSQVEVIDALVSGLGVQQGQVVTDTLTPTLTWGYDLAKNPTADFAIDIATDADFTNIVESGTIAQTSYQTGALTNDTDYYFRVRVNRDPVPFTHSYPFYVGAAIAQPALTSPASPSGLPTDNAVTLVWNSEATSAQNFEIVLASNSSFSNVLKTYNVSADINNAAGAFEYTLPLNDFTATSQVYWRVRGARDSGAAGAWSVTSIFHPNLAELSTPVYRFYNSTTGVHFYTASETERTKIINTLPQFRYEGPSFNILKAKAPSNTNSIPVYRFYNRSTGAHIYSISQSERDKLNTYPQMKYEGVIFYVNAQDLHGTDVNVYRFYNTARGVHFYTSSDKEAQKIIQTLPSFKLEKVNYFFTPAE